MGNCQARRRRRRAERTSETWQSIDCRVEMPVYISLKWPIFAKLWESQKLLDALGFGWPVGCPTASRSLNISTCLMCTLYILPLSICFEDRRELRERGDSYDANDTWANLACSKHGWTLSVSRGQNTSGAVVNLRSNCSS